MLQGLELTHTDVLFFFVNWILSLLSPFRNKTLLPDKGISNVVSEKLCGEEENPPQILKSS